MFNCPNACSLACEGSTPRVPTASRFTRAAFGLFALVSLLGFIALASLLSGCVYRGAKITEGTDLAVGMNIPATDGALQFQLLNYLSGFRLGVAENAQLTLEYTSAETNDYFGIIHTRGAKSVTATVTPNAPTPDTQQTSSP